MGARCRREDDHAVAEMLEITSDMDNCPPQGAAGDDIDDYGPDFISVVKDASEYEHYDNTWLIGVIRGAKRTPLRFQGPWLNVKELLGGRGLRCTSACRASFPSPRRTMQEGMIAGCGDSGRLHNYFAEETVEELSTRAGVRADYPVEVVMDTSIVASEC